MLVDFKRPTSHIKYLSSFTSNEWIKLALSNPIDILIDHAHCERKAAGVAIQLMFRYCLLYTSPSPRDTRSSRMPSSA